MPIIITTTYIVIIIFIIFIGGPPPPFAILQASRGARGGEQPGRRRAGILGQIFDLYFSNKKSVFSRVEWEERVSNERESFIMLLVLFVLFSGYIVSAWYGLEDESTRK